MKKLLSLILALCMIFAFASLTACGGEDTDSKADGSANKPAASDTASKNDTNDTTSEGNVGSIFPDALKNVEAIAAPDLEYTAWDFAGGCVDGKDMNEDEAAQVLAVYGGYLAFEINADNKLSLMSAEQYAEGTYTKTTDGFGYHFQFSTGVEYYAVFTVVGENTVMMIAQPAQPGTALYFVQAERG
jgi:hypothetical protein